jgi:tetratricopeptide (TPR) repeat protein/tRNA A-37 threonylcarbamoyl transferase component Bud32
MMDEESTVVPRSTALTLAAAVDRACDRFEAAWGGAGARPRIEDYLGAVEPSAQALLFRELLASELERRAALGEHPGPAEYQARFPEHATLIAGLFGARPSMATVAPVPVLAAAAAAGPRFRVVRLHAKGGLGIVFLARDPEVNREVALKEIQDRYADDPGCRARFVREAEITGRLEHPGIVPVYGLGSYADGRPYYVMRFIRGESLGQAVARFHEAESPTRDRGERALALRQLLRRFVDVCNTIAYAHSRGVLHRDLKPENVMLGGYGETLVVDWGLTKASGRSEAPPDEAAPVVSEDVGLTQTGVAMGTVSYMSPEQAAGAIDRLAPASDVYSLGATLYCVLAGRPPFAGDGSRAMLARVRAGDFPPPRLVNPGVDRALEAVCLRAMACAPEARYDSARALADEVERWLADEPVSAWREPWVHRLRRWARRHRTVVTAAGVSLAVALAASIAIAGLQFRAASRQRELREKEQNARTLALRRLGQIEKTNALLGSIFQDLDPRAEQREGKPLRAILGERLHRAADTLAGESIGDPLTVARLQATLGMSELNLGNTTDAIALLTRSLRTCEAQFGPGHPGTRLIRNNLATAYAAAGRLVEAIKLLEPALKADESIRPTHPETLVTRNNLAAVYTTAGRTREAIALLEATVKVEEEALGPKDPRTLSSRDNLAGAYLSAGRTREALVLCEATLKLREATRGPNHLDMLTSRNNLARAYAAAGRRREALEFDEATLQRLEATLGPTHPSTLGTRNNLALAYFDAGRTDEALRLLEATLKAVESSHGPSHPNTLSTRSNVAVAFFDAGRTDEALRLQESTLKTQESSLGPSHPNTLSSRHNLAATYVSLGRMADAIAMHEATLHAREATLGPDHPNTLLSRHVLAQAYRGVGRYKEAIALQEQTLKAREATLGPHHPETLMSLDDLAQNYVFAGRAREAIALHEAALKARESALGSDHPDTLANRNHLGRAYFAAGRAADAIAMHESTLKAMEATLGPGHPSTMECRHNLGADYIFAGRAVEAIALYTQSLALMGERPGAPRPDELFTRGGLAVAYLSAGRPDLAIPLFESTLKAQQALFGPASPNTLMSLDNLAGAYAAVGRTAEAIAMFEEALRARRTALGPGHPDTLKTINNLSGTYIKLGRAAEAIALLEPSLGASEATLGPGHPDHLGHRANLGVAYMNAGRPWAALALLEPILKVREATLPPDDPSLMLSRFNLVLVYEAAGEYAKQESLLRAVVATARRQFGPADPRTVNPLAMLGNCLVRREKWSEAEAALRECLAMREAAEPEFWTTFNTRSMLGAALSGQGLHAAAEPLIVSGYEGVKRLEWAIPPDLRPSRLTDAAVRVVRLYEAWGKRAELDAWKTRLGLFDLPADVFAPPLAR